MADSMREQVLAQIATTLEGVRKTAGYEIDVNQVARERWDLVQLQEFPAVVIAAQSEEKRGEPLGIYDVRMRVVLGLFLHNTGSAQTELNQLLAAVEKALLVDTTRGGKAIDTTLIGNENVTGLIDESLAGIELTIEVRYRHGMQDPYAVA